MADPNIRLERVDSFEKNDKFSDYWDQFIKDPIQASYWGIDPNGGVHSFMHEAEAAECATHTDFIVFMAEFDIPNDVYMPQFTEHVEHETRMEWHGCHCGHPGMGCYCQSEKVWTGRFRIIRKFASQVGEWQTPDDKEKTNG